MHQPLGRGKGTHGSLGCIVGIFSLGDIAGILETHRFSAACFDRSAADLVVIVHFGGNSDVAWGVVTFVSRNAATFRVGVAVSVRVAAGLKLVAVCLGNSQWPHSGGGARILPQSLFQHAVWRDLVR